MKHCLEIIFANVRDIMLEPIVMVVIKKNEGGLVWVKKGEKSGVEGSQFMENALPEVEGTKLVITDIVV